MGWRPGLNKKKKGSQAPVFISLGCFQAASHHSPCVFLAMDTCVLGLFLYVASVGRFIITMRRETNKTQPNHQTERVAGWGEVVKEGEDQNRQRVSLGRLLNTRLNCTSTEQSRREDVKIYS